MQEHPPFYAALAPFILDSFDFGEACTDVLPDQVIGGAGTHAVIGARIWLPPDDVGMLVDLGSDFPSAVLETLNAYGPIWVYRFDPTRQTTRGLNTYKGQLREFTYLTPKLPQNPTDFLSTRLFGSSWLHLVAPPLRALDVLSQLPLSSWNPSIVWEPFPTDCVPENFHIVQSLLPRIDIFSPNHSEAAGLLGINESDAEDLATVEKMADSFIEAGAKGFVVIRCGKLGAFARDVHNPKGTHVPPYYQTSSQIVDVTGAGNSFIGGLIAGMKSTNGDIVRATCYGSISASYALEQWGPPRIKSDKKSGQVTWNDDIAGPESRLDALYTQISL